MAQDSTTTPKAARVALDTSARATAGHREVLQITGSARNSDIRPLGKLSSLPNPELDDASIGVISRAWRDAMVTVLDRRPARAQKS